MKRVCTGLIMILVALFFISNINADIAFAEETPIVLRGELVPLTARLLQNGTFGNPVANQRLFFYDQTQDIFIGSAITDLDGFAVVPWNVSINHPLGLTLLNVTFEGNTSLSLSPSYQWSSVIVVSRTTIEVHVEEQTIHPEDEITLTARIVDDHNDSISGVPIAVYSNSILLSTASTNTSGYATVFIDCNISWCTIGENNLKVVFMQDLVQFFNGSETSIAINVQQIITSLETQGSYDSEVYLNESFSLQMAIQAEGIGHSNAPLFVLLDGNPLDELVSDDNGLVTLILDIDSQYTIGTHLLKLEYAGTIRYASSYIELEITVKSFAVLHVEFPELIYAGVETEVQVEFSDLFHRPITDVSITLIDELTQETYVLSLPLGQATASFQITFNGSLGPRNLRIVASGSPFLTNTTGTILVTVWSKPNLFIVQKSILGYASPSQEVTFQIQLNASGSQIPNRLIEWQIENQSLATSTTDTNGVAEETFKLPPLDGSYLLVISYNGSILEYELPTSLEYGVIVSRIMPVTVNLVSYSVSTALQEISVQLQIIALNGTALEDARLNYEWLSHRGFAISQDLGIIELVLRIPVDSGVFNLYYETEETPFTQSSTGFHVIIITQTEASAAQGVGIPIIALSLGVSISLASIPILWRRRLLG
ncbi:MAG: hypothetical protein ACXADC_01465 [Candidatus Thorarchaeota archaeon]